MGLSCFASASGLPTKVVGIFNDIAVPLCSRRDISRYSGSSTRSFEIFCRRSSGNRERRFDGGRRSNRVAELIRREISPLIDDAYRRAAAHEKKESGVLLSVVSVRCSDDLRHARVEVSVFGSDSERKDIMKWLRDARKELRVQLANRVYLKYVPDVLFQESEMSDAVNTVNILNRLAAENDKKKIGSKVEDNSKWGVNGNYGDDLDLDASLDDAIIMDDMDEEDEGLIMDVGKVEGKGNSQKGK